MGLGAQFSKCDPGCHNGLRLPLTSTARPGEGNRMITDGPTRHPSAGKRVLLLWASPTTTNLGVRALREGTAALVERVSPNATILSQNYGEGEAPVNICMGRSLLREFILNSKGLRSWIKGFDLVVDTRAGDSFADIYGLRRLRQMCTMGEFVKACGVPLVLGPQTIGPFHTRAGTALGMWTLRRADTVMARDSVSADLSARLGREVDALTTDVVFALEQPQPKGSADVLLNVSGLLWNSDAHGPADKYRRSIRTLIREIRTRGRDVTLLSHVLDSKLADNDEPTARMLQTEFGLDHVVPTSLDDMRAVAKGANLLIGSRMHACLNSLSVGTPSIPLAYSRKFAPLLGDLGWDHVVDLKTSAFPAGEVLEIIDAESDLRPQVAILRSKADGLLSNAEAALRQYL